MSKAGLDAAVLRWRDADSSAETGPYGLEETLYYCHDANMNGTALVKVVAIEGPLEGMVMRLP